MIDGLKLTLTGEEPETATEENPLLPQQMCENEAERYEWRAEALDFIREHLEPLEIYRLDKSDLEFGELLPPTPDWIEQAEYEERTRVE